MTLVFWLLALAIVITVHEAAHAWMADRLGDPTPRLEGRLSLNPLVHYDQVGTTFLLILSLMRALGFGVIPFGWAKPVRIEPYNLAHPRRDMALISIAGPISNFVLALILSLILRFLVIPFSPLTLIVNLIYPLVILNVSLAIFNLVPISPLDGSKILLGALSEENARKTETVLEQFGPIILLFLIVPTFGGNSLISLVISPVINLLVNLLLPGVGII
jgi:Zn-dependent protease